MSGSNPLAQLVAAFGLPPGVIGNTDTLAPATSGSLGSSVLALGGPPPAAPVIPADPAAVPASPLATAAASVAAPAAVVPAAGAVAPHDFFPNIFGVDFPAGATIFGMPIGPLPGGGKK